MSINLFVYGTLKDQARRSGGVPAKIKADLYDLGPFPCIVPGEGTVHGIMFTVDEHELVGLDRYEGVPSLYTRELTMAEVGDGVSRPTFVYQFARELPPTAKKIESGAWH